LVTCTTASKMRVEAISFLDVIVLAPRIMAIP
jgi:hypothetical protein